MNCNVLYEAAASCNNKQSPACSTVAEPQMKTVAFLFFLFFSQTGLFPLRKFSFKKPHCQQLLVHSQVAGPIKHPGAESCSWRLLFFFNGIGEFQRARNAPRFHWATLFFVIPICSILQPMETQLDWAESQEEKTFVLLPSESHFAVKNHLQDCWDLLTFVKLSFFPALIVRLTSSTFL